MSWIVLPGLKAKPQPMPRTMFNPAIAAKKSGIRDMGFWKRMASAISGSLLVYRSKVFEEWKAQVAAEARIQLQQKGWVMRQAGPVGLFIRIHSQAWCGDNDKLLGAILDALQGVAYKDDAQVTETRVILRKLPGWCIEVELYEPEDIAEAEWAAFGLQAQVQRSEARAIAALKRRGAQLLRTPPK